MNLNEATKLVYQKISTWEQYCAKYADKNGKIFPEEAKGWFMEELRQAKEKQDLISTQREREANAEILHAMVLELYEKMKVKDIKRDEFYRLDSMAVVLRQGMKKILNQSSNEV